MSMSWMGNSAWSDDSFIRPLKPEERQAMDAYIKGEEERMQIADPPNKSFWREKLGIFFAKKYTNKINLGEVGKN